MSGEFFKNNFETKIFVETFSILGIFLNIIKNNILYNFQAYFYGTKFEDSILSLSWINDLQLNATSDTPDSNEKPEQKTVSFFFKRRKYFMQHCPHPTLSAFPPIWIFVKGTYV